MKVMGDKIHSGNFVKQTSFNSFEQFIAFPLSRWCNKLTSELVFTKYDILGKENLFFSCYICF